MMGSRGRQFLLAAAAAVLVTGLSLPAWAETNAEDAPAATEAQNANAADVTRVPMPRARPASVVRKRIASAAPIHRVAARPARYCWWPYQRVAAHWPILILGVGY